VGLRGKKNVDRKTHRGKETKCGEGEYCRKIKKKLELAHAGGKTSGEGEAITLLGRLVQSFVEELKDFVKRA